MFHKVKFLLKAIIIVAELEVFGWTRSAVMEFEY